MAKCQVRWALFPWVCVVAIVGGDAIPRAIAQVSESLRPQSAFTDIADRAARSRALFAEAAKVITSPRCMNCHPAGDSPSQGTTSMSTGRRRFAGKRASACLDCPAPHVIRTKTSRFQLGRQAIRVFLATPAGAWRQSRWHGRANHRLKSVGR